jgi:hypothetical protein
MKVKLIDIYSSVSSLNKLMEQPLSAKISFKLMKLLNAINDEVKLIEEQRMKLVKKYAEDGITVSDSKRDEFLKEFSEFLNEEVDMAWEPISIETLGDLQLSVAELTRVQYLFTE